MSQKFLTNVELEAGLVDGSNSTGTSGFLLSSTGSATSWVDPAAVSVGESEQVHIACKNTSGVAISKGDPVYITGTVGTSFIIQIAKADASDSAKMPAVGLAETDLANNAEGFVIVSGVLKNLTTDPLSTGDGTPSSNDTVYVKVGGGLTKTKPTGASNLIQNVGKVGRVQGTSAGSLAVSTIMRTNDVPNLNTGKIWVGSSTYTTESGVVHLDESQGRMGINKTSLAHALDVSGTIATDSGFLAVATQPSLTFIDSSGGGSVYTSAGSMYFNTGVGSPTVKMAILSGGNVGIGDTTPSHKLDVNGNVNASRYYSNNNTTFYIDPAQTFASAVLAGDLEIGWGSSSSYAMEIGQQRTGNGYAYLDLIGDETYQDYAIRLIRGNTGANAASQLIHRGTGNLEFKTSEAGAMLFSTTNSERMRITSSGNVGIGTTGPGQKLHVNGNVRVTGAYYDSNNSAGTSGQVLSSTATGTDWVSVSDLPIDTRYVAVAGDTMTGTLTMSNAQIQINDSGVQARLNLNNTGTGNPQINFQLGGSSKFTVGVDNNDSDKFKISAGSALGSSDRIVVDSSGNVGIGTTSPAAGYLLDVNGLGAFNTAVSIQGIDTGNPTAANEEIRLSGFGVMGSRTSFYVTNANASGGIYFGIGGAHNANNKALINSSGISAPRYSDIDNSAFYLEPGSGATGQWKVQTPSGYVSIGPNNTSWAHFYTDRSNGYFFDKRIVADSGTFASYNENLTLQAPYNTTRMTINSSNGNVGINNTSPSAKLHVGGSTDQTAVLKIEAGDNTGFPATTSELRMIGYGSRGQGVFFEDTSNSGEEWFAGLNYGSSWDRYSIGYDASGGQAEYIANAILTVIGSTGRVGIGTTSPGSKLHVSGAIQNDQFTIPNTAGTSGQVLAWPATGTTLEWTTAGGGGGASSLNDLSDVLVDTASLYVGTVPSSLLSNPQNNTTLGITAGSSLTSGVNNTIIGSNAANASTNGVDNVIIGYNAVYNDVTINDSVYIGSEIGGSHTTHGDQTVAIGYRVGYITGTADSQVLIGDQVSYNDFAGSGAIAIGKESMYAGPRGNYDVAIGFRSSYNGTRSYSNSVHIGGFAGYFGYGDYNVSAGYQSFYSNINKNGTVCIGYQAGRSGMDNYNIAIGYQSSYSGVLGTNNTVIGGYRAGFTSTLRPGSNCVLLGSNTTASSSGVNNEITLGDSSIATLRCQVTSITSLSDRRDKKDIEDLPYGLEFIDSLKPKKFIWDNRPEIDGDGKEFFSDKKGSKDIGFIAQDLQEVDNEWTQLVYESNPDKLEASYGRLVPVLVQAIKELKAEIELLKNK